MSRDQAYLLDILDSARLALEYVTDKTQDEFLADTQCRTPSFAESRSSVRPLVGFRRKPA